MRRKFETMLCQNIKVVIISRERKKHTKQKGTYSSLYQQTLIPLPFVRSQESLLILHPVVDPREISLLPWRL